MKNKKENGVSLVSLSVAIIIMIIITGTLIYSASNNSEVKKLKNLYSDIELLQDKVSNWYNNNGAIPGELYNNTEAIQKIKEAGQISENDGDVYYKINIKVFDNLTLNYGRGYDNQGSDDIYIINEESHKIYYPKGIKSENFIYYTNDVEKDNVNLVSNIKINLVKLIDDNEEEYKDGIWTNQTVKLKNIEYKGTEFNSLTKYYAICSSNDSPEYKNYLSDIENSESESYRVLENTGEYIVYAKLGEDGIAMKKKINIDKEQPIIDSVTIDNYSLEKETAKITITAKDVGGSNLKEIRYKAQDEDDYKIINISTDDINQEGSATKVKEIPAKQESYVITIQVEDKAGNIVETNVEVPKLAKFKNVDTSITDPESALFSGIEKANIIENDAKNGIVIKDNNENEWVWVEVPKNITESATTDDEIYTALKKYVEPYQKGSSVQENNTNTDKWYEGCGLEEKTYNENKSKMLNSIKNNGGFWISRYEIGDNTISNEEENVRTENSGNANMPVSMQNKILYNYVTCAQAQELSSKMSTDTAKTSSLLFGIQWDLTCKFLEEKNSLKQENINTDSTNWGNYANNALYLTNGSYNIRVPNSELNVWTKFNVDTENYVINSQTNSDENYYQMLTTGASEQTQKMNIYDLAGNVEEWTLEYSEEDSESPCVNRGGSYDKNGNASPFSYLGNNSIDFKSATIGFRVTIY